ncbi:hypothetical protein Tco_1133002 [Tanacetum coccineum]|uniref:Uncharacterized protein n=1 Tax=Tanacetum coccineum TaxID=301880 RepID=A0ABQ5JE61_9ASTR
MFNLRATTIYIGSDRYFFVFLTILIRPGQDIPIGRLYRTHPGRPCRDLTARNSVRPLPSHCLALKYTSHHLDHFTLGLSSDHSSSDHSSSDHFSSEHSTSDHSSSGHSTLGHSLFGRTPSVTTIAVSSKPSRFIYPPPTRTSRGSKAYRRWPSESSPATTVRLSIPPSRALVLTRADLLPPRKRLMTSNNIYFIASLIPWFTSIMVNGKNAYELKGKFLDDLHKNAFIGAYIVGNTLRYQDLEWYDVLKDSKLKEEALKNKAIMEGMIDDDDESRNNGWRRWDGYEIADHDQEEKEYENEQEYEERCELFDNHELSICTIRRFEMTKYLFGQDEEYVAIKEDEYEDLMNTSKEAIHAYQEIFRMMDEGWMVSRYDIFQLMDMAYWTSLKEKKSTMLVENLRSGNFEVLES